jgi:hypothetical protein
MAVDLSDREIEEIKGNELHFWASFRSVSIENPLIDLTKPEQRIRGQFNIESGLTVIAVPNPNMANAWVKLYKTAGSDDAGYLQEAGFKRTQISAPPVPAPSKK